MSIKETVVTEFKADTSGLEAGARKAASALNAVGSSAQSSAKTASVAIDSLTAGLLKFNLAIGAAQTGFAALGKALEIAKFSEEVEKLRKNVSSGLVEAIRTATRGVVPEIEIMRTASKALAGDLRFTESQITMVFKAAKNLSDKGFGDTTENAEKLFKALRKGTTEELKEFGIVVEASKDKGQAFANALSAIDRTAASYAAGMGAASSETARFAAQTSDLAAALKENLGESIRYIIGLASTAMEMLDDLTNNTRAEKGFTSDRGALRAAEAIARRFNAGNTLGTQIDSADVIAMAAKPGMGVLPSGAMVSTRQEQLILQEYEKEVARQRGVAPGGQATPEQMRSFATPATPPGPVARDTRWDSYRPGMYGAEGRRYSTADDLAGPPIGFASPVGNVPFGGGAGPYEQTSQFASLREQSRRESTLGDLFPGSGSSSGGFGSGFKSGFGDVRQEMVGLREIGVETANITQAATMAAVEAAITGQTSVLKAVKAALGAQLMNKAISWGFEGAAMLFTGNPQGAGLIGLAAAAAVAARAMGAGGGGPSMPMAGSRPGGGYVGAPAARPGGNVTIVVSGGNGAQNAVAIDNAIRAARRSGLIPDGDGPGRITS